MRKISIICLISSLLMLSTITISYAWFQYFKNVGDTLILIADFDIKVDVYYLVEDEYLGEINENSIWSKINNTNGIDIDYFIPGEQFVFRLDLENKSTMDAAFSLILYEITNQPKPTKEEKSGIDYFKLSYGTWGDDGVNWNEAKFFRELIELIDEEADYHTGNIVIYDFASNIQNSELILAPNQKYSLYFNVLYDGTGEYVEQTFKITHFIVRAIQAS